MMGTSQHRVWRAAAAGCVIVATVSATRTTTQAYAVGAATAADVPVPTAVVPNKHAIGAGSDSTGYWVVYGDVGPGSPPSYTVTVPVDHLTPIKWALPRAPKPEHFDAARTRVFGKGVPQDQLRAVWTSFVPVTRRAFRALASTAGYVRAADVRRLSRPGHVWIRGSVAESFANGILFQFMIGPPIRVDGHVTQVRELYPTGSSVPSVFDVSCFALGDRVLVNTVTTHQGDHITVTATSRIRRYPTVVDQRAPQFTVAAFWLPRNVHDFSVAVARHRIFVNTRACLGF